MIPHFTPNAAAAEAAGTGSASGESLQSLTQSLVRTFASEIKTADVGPDDNFFDIGGDSLAAEQIILSLHRRYGVEIQTMALLRAPTPRAVARLVMAALETPAARDLVVQLSDPPGRPALAMIHGMNGSPLFASRFGAGLRQRVALMALRGHGIVAGEIPEPTVEAQAARYWSGLHGSLQQVPRWIGGLCTGAHMAVEVGRLSWQRSGRRPALVLIDPMPGEGVWNPGIAPDRGRRLRRLGREIRFWSGLRDLAARLGLAGSAIGRKARREAFKKAQTRAVFTYRPEPFPADLLVIASSEWGAPIRAEYAALEGSEMRVRLVVMPGRHKEFRSANAEAIDREIITFLEGLSER